VRARSLFIRPLVSRRRALWPAVLALAFTGCRQDARINVVAVWADDRPIAELEILALPFNPDRMLDSLATEAPTPPPMFPELLQEMRSYTIPEDDPYAELNRPWLALRDSVAALSDTLMGMERSAPAYAAGYARFRTLYARLADLAAARDRALREVNGERVALARRAAVAADSLRTWEYAAYAAYPDVAAEAVIASGREVVEGVTDKDGTVLLVLDPGRWWLVARSPDETNPFMEYYWNVPVTVTRVIPLRLPLTPGTAVRRWRH
jgi:hypothetical protein